MLTDEPVVLTWSPSIEKLLVKWCDEAKCFEWMHIEAFSYYDTRSRRLMVISNVLTAIAGLSNVIAGAVTVNGFQLSWAFGSLSILVSITNMLQEKLAYLTKAADHKQYSIQWGTIRRKIEEELSIPPESRGSCETFLKYLRPWGLIKPLRVPPSDKGSNLKGQDSLCESDIKVA